MSPAVKRKKFVRVAICSFAVLALLCAQCPSACALKPDPEWTTALPSGTETIAKLIQAISGRPNSEATRELLRGVIKISRNGDSFDLLREDKEELHFDADTALGDRMVHSLERTKSDTDKYSKNLGSVLTGLKSVSVTGNHVELLREEPQEVSIPVYAGSKMIPFRLKEVRISRLSMDLDESKGLLAVKNISGLEVILVAGVELHIVPREFWRTRNEKGDTTVTFGIINPLPTLIRTAFRMKEISYFSHTVRKKKERPAKSALNNEVCPTMITTREGPCR